MDIEILLSLQQFRNGAGGFLTDFLNRWAGAATGWSTAF